MSDSTTATAEYIALIGSIKQTITAGYLHAALAVNNFLVEDYGEICRDIVKRQQEQAWGAWGILRLSTDVRKAHPAAMTAVLSDFSPEGLISRDTSVDTEQGPESQIVKALSAHWERQQQDVGRTTFAMLSEGE